MWTPFLIIYGPLFQTDILKILQPVFQSDFNGIIKNDFSYKRIRDLILKSPEASLIYIWPYLKNELSNNHHLAKTHNYANLLNAMLENLNLLKTQELENSKLKAYKTDVLPFIYKLIIKQLQHQPADILDSTYFSSTVNKLINVLPAALVEKSIWKILGPFYSTNFLNIIENKYAAVTMIELIEKSRDLNQNDLMPKMISNLILKAISTSPNFFLENEARSFSSSY